MAGPAMGIRRRLILAVAAVHAVMMALFVWDLTERQQAMLLARQTEHAEALARTLATSAAGWLAARDVSGLQELAEAQGFYPELSFAMLLDPQGRVLAHTERARIGQYVTDLPPRVRHAVLARGAALVDVATPVLLSGHLVGWVRVGVGQALAADKLAAVTRDGLLYALAAILIGSVLAWALGNWLTARLYAIRRVSEAVRAGRVGERVALPGRDEVGVLGRDFNAMLDALAEQKELAQVTLASIGDAVATTDAEGRITYLNPVAERLTGWPDAQARGRPVAEVMPLLDEASGAPVPDPVARCRAERHVVALANHTLLVSRDGRELAVEDSAAPILDGAGRLRGVVMVFHDVTDRRALTRQMAWQASHDKLTGLTNRFEFEYRLKALIARGGAASAMLYLDLDQFKVVNDTGGHLAGDEMLKRLAHLLQGRVRQADTLARLGGDEFGLLLEDCPLDKAGEIAEGLRAQVQAFSFHWEGRGFQVGVSIGVVPIDPDLHTLGDVLKAADMACYAAKERGRNRIHVHHPGDAELTRRRGELEAASGIRAALEQDRLRLYAQEIRPLRAGLDTHHEVLLRMLGPDGGLVAPEHFIPAAERYGLMGQVDRWVVRAVFGCLASAPRLRLAVNLSGLSLQDEDFVHFVRGALADTGIDPERVCFEITETAAISNLESALAFIEEMKALGFRFALDDFGAGMSSFAYLKNLPVDFLKIDGSFVRDIATDPIDRAFVETINRIGRALGMATIAEFAEDQAVILELTRLAVDYAQGYGVGRPVPMEALLEEVSQE